MNKQAPSTGRIADDDRVRGLVHRRCCCSCGSRSAASTPLGPQGYGISAEFNQAVQLGSQADVRHLRRRRRQGRQRRPRPPHRADPGGDADRPAVRAAPGRHARDPAPEDAAGGDLRRALARHPGGPKLARRRDAARGQVAPTVQLDQILSTFDPATRQAFETWMQQDGIALTGPRPGLQRRARASSTRSRPTSTRCWPCCDRDSAATSTLLNDGGQVFSADRALAGAASGADPQRRTPCSRPRPRSNAALAATIKAFPPFLVAHARRRSTG